MNTSRISGVPVVLQTGFRVFFLGAAVYAVVSMAFWMAFYVMQKNIFVAMPLTVWHGYEMVYGFTMAVVAGFLLTAVMNWTGLPTLSGGPLLILFLFWAGARVAAFCPGTFPVKIMAVCDAVFLFFLIIAILKPILAAGQSARQSAVFSKVILILASGVVFYAALFAGNLVAERKSLRFAVYMIVSLIFTIGRRVVPFFIERGVGYPVVLRNSRTLDWASVVCLILFCVVDLFFSWPRAVAVLSIALAVIHAIRLQGWHTPGVWKKPLLWILFVGYLFLITGFILKAFCVLTHRPDDAALHAFTAGGIGIFTIGMMARVAWGHTGRLIAEPPGGLLFIFVPVVAAAMVRVFFPLVYERWYVIWVAVGQVFWMMSFLAYLWIYFRVLVSPRVDGRWG